jgi:WXG100 family type VII secretion target
MNLEGVALAEDAVAGSGGFEVAPDDVRDFEMTAYLVASQLRSASAILDGEVQGLAATWKGAASASYQAGWSELHSGAVEVWDALFELAAKLGVTADTFTATDVSSASDLSFLEWS